MILVLFNILELLYLCLGQRGEYFLLTDAPQHACLIFFFFEPTRLMDKMAENDNELQDKYLGQQTCLFDAEALILARKTKTCWKKRCTRLYFLNTAPTSSSFQYDLDTAGTGEWSLFPPLELGLTKRVLKKGCFQSFRIEPLLVTKSLPLILSPNPIPHH